MNFILWLIIGGIIGWVASLIMRTDAQQVKAVDAAGNVDRVRIAEIVFSDPASRHDR